MEIIANELAKRGQPAWMIEKVLGANLPARSGRDLGKSLRRN